MYYSVKPWHLSWTPMLAFCMSVESFINKKNEHDQGQVLQDLEKLGAGSNSRKLLVTSKIFKRKPMLPDWHKKARCDFISYCVRVSMIPMLQMLHWRSSKQTVMCTCLWDQNETIKNDVSTHTKPESALKTSREASTSESTDTDGTKWTLCVGTAQLINLRLQTSHDYCHSFVSGGYVTRDRFHFFLFHSFPFLPPSCFPSLPSFHSLFMVHVCEHAEGCGPVEARAGHQLHACIAFHMVSHCSCHFD